MANKTHQDNLGRTATMRRADGGAHDTDPSAEPSELPQSWEFDEDDDLDEFPGWNPTRW